MIIRKGGNHATQLINQKTFKIFNFSRNSNETLDKQLKMKTINKIILIVLFAVIIRFLFFTGVGLSDDLLYSYYSNQISKGNFHFPTDHHGTRIGIVYPVGFLYSLFGVNDFASALLPFIFSIGNVILIYFFGKLLFNKRIGLIASFLMAIFPLDVIFATKPMPDVPSAFFLGLGMYLFFSAERENKNFKYLGCGLSLGISFLLRENAILIALFFMAYALYHRKFKWNYFLIGAGFAFWLLFEMLVFYASTGNPLYRYQAVNQHYLDIWNSENYYGRGSFPSLLFHYPFMIFTNPQLGAFFPFIFIALWFCIAYRKKETYPLIMWLVLVLAYISFGSASLSAYLPLPAVPRYIMMIEFPSMLLLSYFLSQKNKLMNLLMPSVMGILLITSIMFSYIVVKADNQENNYYDSLYQSVKDYPNILTDPRTRMKLEYVSGYKTEINQFDYCEENCNSYRIEDKHVLVNYRMLDRLTFIHPTLKFPDFVKNPPDWRIIKQNEDFVLYYAR